MRLTNVYVNYDGVEALRDVSMEIFKGEIVTLVGSNGAGKSTMLGVISGMVRPSHGKIEFKGRRIDRLPPEAIVRCGVSQVAEGRRIFRSLSVTENLAVAGFARGLPTGEIRVRTERIFELFPNLKRRSRALAWSLSGGEQQMLVIGRALLGKPELLMLDEPSLGLAPKVIEEVFRAIKGINESGTTILLVEQNARMALSISQRGYVLDNGSIVLSGKASELMKDDDVVRAYLG